MYILALDGGGTKTLARIYDFQGNILKEAVGPSSNIVATSFESVASELRSFFENNFSEFDREKIFLSGGMAGAGREHDKAKYRELFSELGYKNSLISTDAHTALVGGHNQKKGALLICGTGSIALYLDEKGEVRVGGWGHILGDEGSGYYFGLEALKVAMKVADGRLPHSEIKDKVFKHFNITSHNELIPLVYGKLGKKEIAELARIVLTTEDEIAAGIVSHGARDVYEMLLALKKNSGQKSIDICFTGGIIENDTPMRRELIKKFANSGINLIERIGDPCYGAFLLGKEEFLRVPDSITE